MKSNQAILLIEPNKLFAQTVEQALSEAGYRDIMIASSAQAAIDCADKQKPALVILEIQLAKHNGIEFLYEFRSYADWQNIPVIVYSQIPPGRFHAMKKQLQQLGVVNYLDKSKTNLTSLIASARDVLDNESVSR